ncbi:MAG: phosphodiester glycosidase family protein [Roseobacter sp.]
MIRISSMVILLWAFWLPAYAVTCEKTVFDDQRYTICQADPRTETFELFLRDGEGQIYGQFSNIDRALAAEGRQLVFAMNAGMYHDDRSPVGHYIEDGQEIMRVIPNAGPGNFGLLPNGILCLQQGRADVFETTAYLEQRPACKDATQSGPMLVINGALHPKFLESSTSTFIRNGVGTSADGARIVFAISDEPVNFHSFGRLFRDRLETPNALFFDGNISRLYAADLGRRDFGFSLGPIIGIVEAIQ